MILIGTRLKKVEEEGSGMCVSGDREHVGGVWGDRKVAKSSALTLYVNGVDGWCG